MPPADSMDQEAQSTAESTPSTEEDQEQSNSSAHTDEDGDEEHSDRPVHPIAQATDNLLNRVRDTEQSIRMFLPMALERFKEERDSAVDEFKEGEQLLSQDSETTQIIGAKKVLNASRRVKQLRQSRVPYLLESTLFVGLFAAYDTFLGDLLTAIYQRKPELLVAPRVTVDEG